jgi:ABC-2 type transport system permease protein
MAALFIPIPVFLTAVFAMGIGLILSAGVVYFADMIPIYEVLLTAWLYLTPIIYPLEVIPDNLIWLIKINPMYYFVESFRLPLYAGEIPSPTLLLIDATLALVALILGWWLFSSKSNEYAYRI